MIWPQPGYPFLVRLSVTYSLAADALTIMLHAMNEGSAPAPYGCSIHPYLAPRPGPVDNWTLRLPAASFLTADPDRLLPTGQASVAGTEFDFREGRPIEGQVIDHAFTELAFGKSGVCDALVTDEDGHGVLMRWTGARVGFRYTPRTDRNQNSTAPAWSSNR